MERAQLFPLRSSEAESDEARVDLAPLIDVVFLLLIFYVVTATFSQPTAVPIERPQASQASALPERPVIITIAADGSSWLNDVRWRPDQHSELHTALTERGSKRVLIEADGAVPTRRLIEIVDHCRAAGAEQVDIAAEHQR